MDSIHQPIAQTDKPENYDVKRQHRLVNEIMELLVTHHGGSLSEDVLDESIDALQKAIHLAQEAHRHQVRKSGEPYFFHPLRVAHMAARHCGIVSCHQPRRSSRLEYRPAFARRGQNPG